MFLRRVSRLTVALAVLGVLLALPPTAALAADHGGSASLNPLSFEAFQKDLAIWTLVVFVVLLLILWKFAWGPINDGLQKREQRVLGEIASAEKANQDAKQLLADYEQRLAASESQVREIIERGRRDAEEVGRQILEKARAETEAEKQRALREIDAATAGALKGLAEKSADLAVELAGKIVAAKLDPQAHSRMIEEAMDRFAKTSPNGGRK